ncbi:MAG: HAD-IIIC family phosphatase [Vicinamibacterales bacterium]
MRATRPPKCVVWDLDDTVWQGTLAEGDAVQLRPGVRETLEALDARGILNSIASRNDADLATARLHACGLSNVFLFPQVGWGAKSESIRRIAEALNIGVDAIAFIDDQPFERDEVGAVFPSVRRVGAEQAHVLLDVLGVRDMPVTEESRSRRGLYQAEQARRAAEVSFEGPSEAFLATLDMVVTIAPAREEDLDRADELTRRTNQLNSTGRTYSREELLALRRSPHHQLQIVSLEDTYGSYGRIGLALVACRRDVRVLELLLMSCRVMSRGIGTVVLHHLMRDAKRAGARFLAHFVRTDRNRQMLVTYRFAGFRDVGYDGRVLVLEHDLESIPPQPPYVRAVQTCPT